MIFHRAILAAAALLLPVVAHAQSYPTWLRNGYVPTAAQWQQAFASKQDALLFIPLNTAGGIMTGRLVTAAIPVPGSTGAGLNLPHGVAPATPVNGDVWTTTSGLYAWINGAQQGPFVSAVTCATLPALTGDVTTSAGSCATSITNLAVTNAKLTTMAAFTFKGNPTGSTAAPTDFTITSLTTKASPAAGDLIPIEDSAAGFALKKATVASIAVGAAVADLNSQTGSLTFNAGITNSTTTFSLDPAYTGTALSNCTITASASAGALTIALKDNTGADPSAASPCIVNFRNVTGTTGATTPLKITAATSFVISSGSNYGISNSTAFRLWVVIFNDGGTARLGAINASAGSTIYPLREDVPISSTAEGGTANSPGVIYTGTAVTSKSMRIVGYLEWSPSGLASAGTWTTTNFIYNVPMTRGVRLPGEVVQGPITSATSTSATISTITPTTSNLAGGITLRSGANLVRLVFSSTGSSADPGNSVVVRPYRGPGCGTFLGLTQLASTVSPVSGSIIDRPNSISALAYFICFFSLDGVNNVSYPVSDSVMTLEEIQG